VTRHQKLGRAEFRERLLRVMEAKVHWAWPGFTGGLVPRHLLHIHLEQEYATYVRDFPLLVGRAYVQCPIPEVRRELAANLYEEETGGVVAGKPHPELFLDIPRGLGMNLARFARVKLVPAAARYRAYLDGATERRGWEVATAVTTLFVEGTSDERREIDSTLPKVPAAPLSAHPLVKHYGLPPQCLRLSKAHREVEGEHRAAAWRIVLDRVPASRRTAVLVAMNEAVRFWLAYRDAVARACGLRRDLRGSVRAA